MKSGQHQEMGIERMKLQNKQASFEFLTVAGIFKRLLLGVVCSLSLTTAHAQPPKPPATTPPATGTDPAVSERLVYLPYKNLKDVFEREGATVFMPYLQFLKMWQPPAAPVKPPVNAVLTSATYKATVEKEQATIQAELVIQVLAKSSAELPLEFGNAAIGKISSADNKVLLRGTGDGAYSLLFPEAGEYKVQLELATRVRTSPEGKSLDIQVPSSGITNFDISVPAADQTIDITPQLVTTAGSSDAKSTRAAASLGATRKIAARWYPKLSTAPRMEFLATVQNMTEVRVADGLVHTQAVLTYQVLRGELDQIRLQVPAKQRILDVSVAGLKSWKAVTEGQKQIVTIDLLSQTSKTVAVEVHTERAIGDEAFEVAGIDASDAVNGVHAFGPVRESGLVVLSHSADLTLGVDQQSGLVRVEASEVPAAARRADAVYYKFYTPKFRLQASVKPVEPRLLVDHQTRLTFTDDELQLAAELKYVVERAGVFELRFKVPAGLKVDRVECDQMQEFKTPEGLNLLIVSLREKTRGEIKVSVFAHQPLDAAKKDAQALPILEPQNVTRETGHILVFAPESLEVITDAKKVQAAQPYRPDNAQPPAQTRLASAWSYTRRPLEIPVRTERRPTRLTASVATTVQMKQDVVEVQTLLQYTVDYAGLSSFRFAVPEAAVAGLQVESADATTVPLKETSKAEQAENGWVTYTVVLQRELTGTFGLKVRYDLKPATAKGNQLTATIQPLRVLPAPGKTAELPPVTPASVYGEVLVQHDQALSVAAQAGELESIDVRELTRLPQSGAIAYRYYKQPEKLDQPLKVDLTATRHEIQPVVETVVLKGFVEAVLTRDESVTYRCRYLVKSSARQRLSIDLPKTAQPLDTMVAGQRVDLEKREVAAGSPGSDKYEFYSINVARKTPADVPFEISLVFRSSYAKDSKGGPLAGTGGGKLSLILPRIGGAASNAVAVQHTMTKLWVPREYALVGTPKNFVREGRQYVGLLRGVMDTDPVNPDTWFGSQSGGLFAFTTSGHPYVYSRLGASDTLDVGYWRTSLITWIVSGTLLLIAFVLLPTSWENKLSLLLLIGFGLAMYALRDEAQALHALSAARFGLIAMVGLWVIHALTRPRAMAAAPALTATNPPAATPGPSETPPVVPPT